MDQVSSHPDVLVIAAWMPVIIIVILSQRRKARLDEMSRREWDSATTVNAPLTPIDLARQVTRGDFGLWILHRLGFGWQCSSHGTSRIDLFTGRRRRMYIFVAIGNLALGPGFGFLMKFIPILQSPQQYLPVTDLRELPLALIAALVLAPLAWTMYLWQPIAFSTAILRLQANRALGGSMASDGQVDAAIRSIRIGSRRGVLISVAILACTLVGSSLWFAGASTGAQQIYGHDLYWWQVHTAYIPLFVALTGVAVYMVIYFCFRTFYFALILNKLVHDVGIIPRPLHRDGCNGLAAVGSFAWRSLIPLAVLMVWYPLLFSVPQLIGDGHLDLVSWTVAPVMVLYLLYFGSVVALLKPILSIHRTMADVRATEVERAWDAIHSRDSQEAEPDNLMELALELRQRLDAVDLARSKWPFGVSPTQMLIGICLPYAMSLILGIAASVIANMM